MNARQKAKYYKKLYEKTNIKPIVCNSETVKLKCKESVPRELFLAVVASGVMTEPEIKHALAYKLAKELMDHITVEVEASRNPYYINIVGSVEVIKNDKRGIKRTLY